MSSPLARYLRDFGAEAAPAQMHLNIPVFAEEPAEPAAMLTFDEPVDLEAERQAVHDLAYNEGHQAATEALTTQHAEELANLKEQHEAELAAQKDQFEGGLADYLAKALPELSERISQELSEAAARLFIPLLREKADQAAVEELAAQLRSALAVEIREQVKISGPAHLCDMLRDQLGEQGVEFIFEPSDAPNVYDLRVEIGDSLLVTRLSAFAADLERVLA